MQEENYGVKIMKRKCILCLLLVLCLTLLPVAISAEDSNCSGSHAGWTPLLSTSATLSSGHYYLENNLTTSGDITVTGDVTLCLNGKKITIRNESDCINVTGNGNLTLCDCAGTGEIKKMDTGVLVRAAIYLGGNGRMTICGGKIVSESYNAISCSTTGDLCINGGTLSATQDCIVVEKINDLTISSGTITSSNGSGVEVDYYNNAGFRNITISGGNIEGKTGGLKLSQFVCTGKIVISGGTLNGKGPVPNATTYAGDYYGLSFMSSNGGACNVTISGGNLIGARGGIYTNDSLVDISISGGIVGSRNTPGIDANGGTFQIDGGQVYTLCYNGPVHTAMTNGELYGLSGSEGTFRLYGGIVGCVGSSKSTTGISIFGSNPPKENPISVEIHQGTVVGSNYAIQSYGVSKLMISGGTLSGGTADLYLNVYDGATITNANSSYLSLKNYNGDSLTVAHNSSLRNEDTYIAKDVSRDGLIEMVSNTHVAVYDANAGTVKACLPHTHDYQTVVTKPTCTKGGYTTYTCACGDSYIADKVDALGHTEAIDAAVAPNCSETGLTEGVHCSVCGEILVAQEEIPTNDTHDFVDSACQYCGLVGGTCGDGVNWTLSDDGKMTIYGTGNISVGNGDNDKPWKDYRDRIVHLEIMEGIGRIASYWAFANCENLTQLTLHEGLEEIGPYAFQNTGLTSVTIPASVTRIYDNVFNYCPNLTAITVDPENTKYTNDSYGALFTKDMKTMMQMPGAYTGSYRIPDGVETLFWGAFAGCQLSEVIIPASVNYIDIQTFDDCSNLKTIWFEGDAPAESESFHFDSVATAYYPANNDTWTDEIMERMGGEVFGGEITWVAYTPSATIASGTCGENLNWKLTEEGTLTISGSGDMYEFSNVASSEPPWEAYADQITNVNIKPGVTSIGRYAFYHLEQLETVSIPEGITKIGDHAFYFCSKLSGIDIPESVTTIGDGAFCNCYRLTAINLSKNVSDIGLRAFANCSRVPGIWVDEDNPYFSNDEYGVLYNKDKTTLIQMSESFEGAFTVPDSVTTIGESAFWFCDGMTSISLSENVTSIGNYAFNYCSGLTSIDLPSGLKFIDYNAFSNCNYIGEITIPASVEKMGTNPFQDMAKLSWITVEEGNEFFCNDEYGVLFNKDKTVLIAIPALLDVKYSIPEGVKEIGKYACESKNIPAVVIPASVEKINDWSFSYREQLKEIIFLGDAPKMETYAFSGTTATCYYPADNATWTESVRQNYGGTLTWVEQTPEVDYIPGDVNGDNVVDLLDVITLVQYVSDGCMTKPDGFNITLNESAANVNDDGVMDLLDVILICQYVSDGCVTNPDGFNVELLPSKPRN